MLKFAFIFDFRSLSESVTDLVHQCARVIFWIQSRGRGCRTHACMTCPSPLHVVFKLTSLLYFLQFYNAVLKYFQYKMPEIIIHLHVGCCDIEKISNIDIEKKIPVISIFSIFFCCEIIRMKLGFLFREKH